MCMTRSMNWIKRWKRSNQQWNLWRNKMQKRIMWKGFDFLFLQRRKKNMLDGFRHASPKASLETVPYSWLENVISDTLRRFASNSRKVENVKEEEDAANSDIHLAWECSRKVKEPEVRTDDGYQKVPQLQTGDQIWRRSKKKHINVLLTVLPQLLTQAKIPVCWKLPPFEGAPACRLRELGDLARQEILADSNAIYL